MEIHAPHQPVHTWRDVLVHLAIVTVGILIALSLEQVTEWIHHKSIVREAKENISNELRDNQKQLDGALPGMDTNIRNQERALALVNDLLAHKKMDTGQITIAFSTPAASSTSWRAAEAVGALSFMDYPTLKKYAEVYEEQNSFLQLQTRTQETVIAALTYFHDEHLNELNLHDLEEARKGLLASIAGAKAHRQVAAQMSAEYRKVLASTE